MARIAIIRGGYVINVIEADPEYVYPHPHDLAIEDPTENIGPGHYYEASEGIFYLPMSTPPDLPAELQ
jgi:hypothetical protein